MKGVFVSFKLILIKLVSEKSRKCFVSKNIFLLFYSFSSTAHRVVQKVTTRSCLKDNFALKLNKNKLYKFTKNIFDLNQFIHNISVLKPTSEGVARSAFLY